MEQQDLHKRLLLALVLSFLVFVGYSFLIPTSSVENSISTAESTQTSPEAPRANLPTTSSIEETKAPPIRQNDDIVLRVVSDNFIWSIDSLGRIFQAELLEQKYREQDGKPLSLLSSSGVKPLEIRFQDSVINDEAFKKPYEFEKTGELRLDGEAKKVTLTQRLSDLIVTKELTFHPNGHYDVRVFTSKPTPYFVTTGSRPVGDKSIYWVVRGALIKEAKGSIATIEDGDAKGEEVFANAPMVSAFDRYYSSLFFDFSNGLNVSILKDGDGNPLAFIRGDGDLSFGAYLGPKDYRTLAAIYPDLTQAIEYGWFTFLAEPFFKVIMWIHGYVGNWGWAIVLFTILVKIVLFPLSFKGMMSMQKLKDLAPKLKELKEKYGDDKAKMNMKMMEMYQKHGANPMGGCLPLLLQIPVFFALYRVLLNADELQGAPWIFWINDLSRMDPYFILPILMGVSMYLQQKITPSNFTDPLQEKIFKFFPVIVTLFMFTFPSGLVLYWFTNNLLSIAQQYYINYAYEKQKQQEIAAHHKPKEY
ncbi:MAG TPA: membrane protein insertase YidC [Epsilonproteobacteria bacterium]|nr:membrane protein insertase YidC [Campylobacterota bacterium]